jgi:NTE family protein
MRTEIPTPSFVKVEGVDSKSADEITETLASLNGKPIDQNELENSLRKVWGAGRFETLDYEWVREGGKDGLLIHTTEKTYGPPFLDIGLVVNNSATDDTEVNLLGRLTFFDFGRSDAEWRTNFSLGTRLGVNTEYFRPIGDTRFFVAPSATYDTQQRDLFTAGHKIAEYKLRTLKAGLDLGYSLNARSQMRLGYSIGRARADRVVGDPIFPDLSGTQSVMTFGWNYLGQNSPQFPTRGLFVRSQANYYFKSPGASSGFPQAELRANYGYRFTENNFLTM